MNMHLVEWNLERLLTNVYLQGVADCAGALANDRLKTEL
jgi:hypothetical protein